MDILKNKIELASQCAEVALLNAAQLNRSSFPEGVFKTELNGDVRYTEEAQDMFNNLYDIYTDLINEHTN
jgi:hypothetical protein